MLNQNKQKHAEITSRHSASNHRGHHPPPSSQVTATLFLSVISSITLVTCILINKSAEKME